MNSIHSEFIKADNLLREFVEKSDKFSDRFTSLLTGMNAYIEKSGYMDKVVVNEMVLEGDAAASPSMRHPQ